MKSWRFRKEMPTKRLKSNMIKRKLTDKLRGSKKRKNSFNKFGKSINDRVSAIAEENTEWPSKTCSKTYSIDQPPFNLNYPILINILIYFLAAYD